jgi:hopanoid biosynthesis associated RND transporter like protein HpnN
MTAERMPPSNSSSHLVGLLESVTRVATSRPWATTLIAGAIALLSLAYAATYLEIRTSRLDLLNPESAYNKLWIRYIKEFGHKDDAVVVVEGSHPAEITAAIDQIATAVSLHSESFEAVLSRTDLTGLRRKGLHYLPSTQLSQINQFLNQVDPVLQGDWSQLNLGRQAAQIAVSPPVGLGPSGVAGQWAALAENLLAALRDPQQYRCPWPALPAAANLQGAAAGGGGYLLSSNGRLGMLLLRLAPKVSSSPESRNAIVLLRELLAGIARSHPSLHIGLTGLPIMEQDEMDSSQTAMFRASLISTLGVALLFTAGFGRLRQSLMTVIALTIGIAWSIGAATLIIGHLNILSMAFGVILIGLGIDFGIHYLARYQQLRRLAIPCQDALCQTVAAIGPGVVTGGVTTSVAFFTAGLTKFTGIAELGIIAGSGVLLCLLATIVVLPALIVLIDRRGDAACPTALPLGKWIAPIHKAPRVTLGLACGVTLALGLGVTQLRYDHNLLNLQPVGLESVEMEHKLLTDGDRSLWFALSVANNRAEALARKEKFLRLASVDRVEELASLVPQESAETGALVERIHARLGRLPERPPQIPVASPEQLGQVIAAAVTRASSPQADPQLRRRFEQIAAELQRLPARDCYRRLADYQQRLATDLLAQLRALRQVSDPRPPSLSDLPPSLVTRFVSHRGRYLLRIYGKGSIWDMDALSTFVADVRRVDPQATGKPLQTYEASRQMQQSYMEAAIYSLLAVSTILMINFRSIRAVLLAMLPLAVGTLQMLGILGLLGLPLNPANMIVLPLILGIGIDDGVHVVHDARTQKGRYRLTNSTAMAVLMTSLTSMLGFGSLMIANHRGLQSLGRVLTLGVSCCLFASLLILPAILAWRSTHARHATTGDDAKERDDFEDPEETEDLPEAVDQPPVDVPPISPPDTAPAPVSQPPLSPPRRLAG